MEIWVTVWIISAIITFWIAKEKGHGILGFFLGCFLGPLGIFFALACTSKILKEKKPHTAIGIPIAEERPHDTIVAPESTEATFGQNLDNSRTPNSDTKSFDFTPFFIKSIGWCAFTYLIATQFATNHFWVVVLSVFLFSVPIALCGIYANTIRQIRRLHIFANRGRLFRLFSGRPFKVILWISWALVTSFLMLVQFHTYNSLEWCVLFLVISVFWFVFTGLQRFMAHEIKSYLITSMPLAWSRRLCPVLMLLVYVVLIGYFGDTTAYPSLADAINAKKAAVSDMTGSALVQEVSQYLAFYDGVKAYALGRLGSPDTLLQLALLGIINLVVFYNACAILSCFLISGMEYRRVFGPLSDADQPPPVLLSRIAAIFAFTAFLSLFIYLPLFCYKEA